jgi:hypothetical protein
MADTRVRARAAMAAGREIGRWQSQRQGQGQALEHGEGRERRRPRPRRWPGGEQEVMSRSHMNGPAEACTLTICKHLALALIVMFMRSSGPWMRVRSSLDLRTQTSRLHSSMYSEPLESARIDIRPTAHSILFGDSDSEQLLRYSSQVHLGTSNFHHHMS